MLVSAGGVLVIKSQPRPGSFRAGSPLVSTTGTPSTPYRYLVTRGLARRPSQRACPLIPEDLKTQMMALSASFRSIPTNLDESNL